MYESRVNLGNGNWVLEFCIKNCTRIYEKTQSNFFLWLPARKLLVFKALLLILTRDVAKGQKNVQNAKGWYSEYKDSPRELPPALS